MEVRTVHLANYFIDFQYCTVLYCTLVRSKWYTIDTVLHCTVCVFIANYFFDFGTVLYCLLCSKYIIQYCTVCVFTLLRSQSAGSLINILCASRTQAVSNRRLPLIKPADRNVSYRCFCPLSIFNARITFNI